MIEIKDNTKLFFTSDTHFYHNNIIEYAKRPFKTLSDGTVITKWAIDVMHETLISNWNWVVKTDSIVFIVGDFAFLSNIEKIGELLDSLNGIKYLVAGNHDYQNKFDRKTVKSLFEGFYDIAELKVYDDEMDDGYQRITLCHYPKEYLNNKSKGQWHLHGHIHSSSTQSDGSRLINKIAGRYDVGVDNNNFTPVSYQELKNIITRQSLGL